MKPLTGSTSYTLCHDYFSNSTLLIIVSARAYTGIIVKVPRTTSAVNCVDMTNDQIPRFSEPFRFSAGMECSYASEQKFNPDIKSNRKKKPFIFNHSFWDEEFYYTFLRLPFVGYTVQFNVLEFSYPLFSF